MRDPRSLDVWLRWESDTLNAGVVARTRSLRDLLEGRADLRTKRGDAYPIDAGVLERLAAACSPEERDRLRLPVTIRFGAEVADSAYMTDALAAEILRRIEAWGETYLFRDGRAWLPRSLAVDLILRYGGALQPLIL